MAAPVELKHMIWQEGNQSPGWAADVEVYLTCIDATLTVDRVIAVVVHLDEGKVNLLAYDPETQERLWEFKGSKPESKEPCQTPDETT